MRDKTVHFDTPDILPDCLSYGQSGNMYLISPESYEVDLSNSICYIMIAVLDLEIHCD